ncbi:molecular chaperone DnaJ [Desulforhopalus sp. 52FAK]
MEMEQIKANLFPCAHCAGTGTCKNGSNEASCAACSKYHELKGKEYFGLTCGTCGGLGLAEPTTERINKRTKPLLAMGIVFVMLTILSLLAFTNNPHFTEVLAFASTLIGGIVAYYFTSTKHINT